MAIIDLIASLTPTHIAGSIGLVGVYTLYGVIWRLYFSPIAHIPGPRLAALTWWYEFYYDIILGGQYVFKMRDLHREYGPIIRINPEEIHIYDPDFFPQLYGAGLRRDRWRFYTKQFAADGGGIGTVEHDLHKIRRAALNPFFSKQSVRSLQPVIEERVNALLSRLHSDGKAAEKKPIDILYPYSALTNDIINEYAFARSDHLIEDPSYGKPVTDHFLTGTHYGKYVQHYEIVLTLISALPEFISGALVPGWRGFLKMKKDIHATIAAIAKTQHTARWELDVSHRTIFHDLLSSETLPPAEKSLARLADEGRTIVQAGTLTSSWALAIANFHLLHKPHILARLRAELNAAIPDPNVAVPVAELENLPFLRAIIKETLRHSLGASGRSARVCPDETLTYTHTTASGETKSYVIPPGVPVGMSNYHTLTNPDIYADPFSWNPDRWFGPDAERLDKYFTVFSGGARACLGLWLTQAEMTLAMARLWRIWDGPGEEGGRGEVGGGRMRLFETDEKDAMMAADYFIPIPWKGTKGIRVVLESYE
ncbi:cytochrome P450 CYP542B3 [Podospora aff. communis PSN243]|uniref:Cytochrome P450 CYP542B3 n=1 Tax=Podospora aff. communis PSN243 TaxID=3040156 RepID=A0AAV9GWY0_9PEZI|nr:cytochrome P450 CYP542B3 [Podospora aff. communis PSN243]